LLFRPLPRFEVRLGNAHAIVLFVNAKSLREGRYKWSER
jgi:hypothetical protein